MDDIQLGSEIGFDSDFGCWIEFQHLKIDQIGSRLGTCRSRLQIWGPSLVKFAIMRCSQKYSYGNVLAAHSLQFSVSNSGTKFQQSALKIPLRR